MSVDTNTKERVSSSLKLVSDITVMVGASLIGFTVNVKFVESEYSPSETIAVITELPFQLSFAAIVNNESSILP